MSDTRRMLRRFLMVCLLAIPVQALGHEGPPYPLFVDQKAGVYTLSVWGDPDIGTGKFYIVVNTDEKKNVPGPLTAGITVRPVDQRVPATRYIAKQQKSREGIRFYVEVPFEKQEKYNISIEVRGPSGTGNLATIVEATPDDALGPLGLLVYLAPFLALGFIWLKAFLKNKKRPKPSLS